MKPDTLSGLNLPGLKVAPLSITKLPLTLVIAFPMLVFPLWKYKLSVMYKITGVVPVIDSVPEGLFTLKVRIVSGIPLPVSWLPVPA